MWYKGSHTFYLSLPEEKDLKQKEKRAFPGGGWHSGKNLRLDMGGSGNESNSSSATDSWFDLTPVRSPLWAFSFFISEVSSIY